MTTCLSVFLPTLTLFCIFCHPSLLLHWQTGDVKIYLHNVNIFFIFFVFTCVFVQPFGVNQPGPYVMYTTVDSNGYLKNASGKNFLS